MTTLHTQAASKPLTYITPTSGTVTPPEALYSLYGGISNTSPVRGS